MSANAKRQLTRRVGGGVVAGLLLGSVIGITTVAAQDDSQSALTLDYDSAASVTSSAGVICESRSQTGSGDEIDITLTGLDAGEECVIPYPERLDCTVVINPADHGDNAPGLVTVNFPQGDPTTVLVDIDCTDADAVSETVATTTEAPEVEVAGTAETNTTLEAMLDAGTMPVAPAAEAIVGTPAFTG